jgi:hypothetical protein
MKLQFEGYGDDTFCERTRKLSFDNAATGRPIVFEVKAPDGDGMRVWGLYSPKDEPEPVGVWTIGFQPLDEGVPIPEWPFWWDGVTRDGESARFVVDAPEGVTVRCLNKRGDQ